MPGRLEGKVALVVGGGQLPGQTIGNGRATALAFAREGARVAVMDRVVESAEETVALIQEQDGKAIALAGDVISEADCTRVVEDTRLAFGRIDVLQNNVGIGIGDDGPTHISAEAWRHILEVNLTGMFLMARQVLPAMQAAKTGVITNISSIVSTLSDSTLLGSSLAEEGRGRLLTGCQRRG